MNPTLTNYIRSGLAATVTVGSVDPTATARVRGFNPLASSISVVEVGSCVGPGVVNLNLSGIPAGQFDLRPVLIFAVAELGGETSAPSAIIPRLITDPDGSLELTDLHRSASRTTLLFDIQGLPAGGQALIEYFDEEFQTIIVNSNGTVSIGVSLDRQYTFKVSGLDANYTIFDYQQITEVLSKADFVFYDVVRDDRGNAIPGVQIQVYRAGTSSLLYSTETDMAGAYSIPWSEISPYSLVDIYFSGARIVPWKRERVLMG